MNLILHKKPGAKPNMIIRRRLPLIIEELVLATPSTIRRRHLEKYGEPVAWTTVARHLRVLVKAGIVAEQVSTAGKGYHIVLYRLTS